MWPRTGTYVARLRRYLTVNAAAPWQDMSAKVFTAVDAIWRAARSTQNFKKQPSWAGEAACKVYNSLDFTSHAAPSRPCRAPANRGNGGPRGTDWCSIEGFVCRVFCPPDGIPTLNPCFGPWIDHARIHETTRSRRWVVQRLWRDEKGIQNSSPKHLQHEWDGFYSRYYTSRVRPRRLCPSKPIPGSAWATVIECICGRNSPARNFQLLYGVRNGSSAVVPWSSRRQSRESGEPGESGYMYKYAD